MLKPCANIKVLPGSQVRRNFVVIQIALNMIRHQDHGDVGALDGVRDAQHLEARGSGLGRALAARMQAHHHVHAAVAQIQRMRVALASVTDDGDRLAFVTGSDRRLFRNIVLP